MFPSPLGDGKDVYMRERGTVREDVGAARPQTCLTLDVLAQSSTLISIKSTQQNLSLTPQPLSAPLSLHRPTIESYVVFQGERSNSIHLLLSLYNTRMI